MFFIRNRNQFVPYLKSLMHADSLRFVNLLKQLPIIVDHDPPEKEMKDLLAIGRCTGLSSYDASYVHLAIRHDCPLATLDHKLAEAAKVCKVGLFE